MSTVPPGNGAAATDAEAPVAPTANGHTTETPLPPGIPQDTPGLHRSEADEKGSEAPSVDAQTFEVGWDGGDRDPLCPRSLSQARKWLIVTVVAICSCCVTCASSIYVSTYEQMEAEFGNSRIVSTLGLSMFVLGISLGPMLLGPLSEFYGRRPIYLISWTIYIIWIIPQAVAQNIQTILVTRFLDGFSGSAFLAVSGGTVGDLFAKNELQAPMALFSVMPFLGPVAGPLIGGFINFNTNWRWTYWFLLLWSAAQLVALVFLVPETYLPMALKMKAEKLRKDTGEERWFAPIERHDKSILATIRISLLRPFQLLWFESMVSSLCSYSALLLGVLYLFFGAFPLVFRTVYGFNLWQVGLSFLGLLVGLLLGAATTPVWHRKRNTLIRKLEQETGIPDSCEPEFWLPSVICGSFLVPAGTFIFGWSAFSWVHWIVPIIGSVLYGAGMYLAFSGIFTFLVDAYPLYAASTLAANAFLRCFFAAVFPLFGPAMYDKMGIQWATTLLAIFNVFMIPWPFFFFKYGKSMRMKSRFATS